MAGQNHQIKCDKIPILILAGEASCGKSKISQYVANANGKSLRPIVNYKVKDILGLPNWGRSGSDIVVFDDFNFLGRTRDEPTIMFNQLKFWASGLPVEIHVAQTSKAAAQDSNVKVNGIFISVNKIPQEAVDKVDGMPKMVDRFTQLI